jgi:hypothetical protein
MFNISVCGVCDVVILEPSETSCPICKKPVEIREVPTNTVIGSQHDALLIVEPGALLSPVT